MKMQSPRHISAQELSRCQQRTPTGRRCRGSVADAANGLCSKHVRSRQKQREAADLTAVLTGNHAEFKSAAQINDFLSKLVVLLAQNRISSRRAAVLAYINQLLLRTLPAIEQERDSQSPENSATPVIVMDVARPTRPPSGQPS